MLTTYVEGEALSEFPCTSQNFTTFVGCKSGQWPGVESRVFKAKTAVHTVGGEFESHLLDVPLEENGQLNIRRRMRGDNNLDDFLRGS